MPKTGLSNGSWQVCDENILPFLYSMDILSVLYSKGDINIEDVKECWNKKV